jgi:hypothetical protein
MPSQLDDLLGSPTPFSSPNDHNATNYATVVADLQAAREELRLAQSREAAARDAEYLALRKVEQLQADLQASTESLAELAAVAGPLIEAAQLQQSHATVTSTIYQDQLEADVCGC